MKKKKKKKKKIKKRVKIKRLPKKKYKKTLKKKNPIKRKKVLKLKTYKAKPKKSFILNIIRFQYKLKPKFKIKIDIFNIDRAIQGFFQKIDDKIQEYKRLRLEEKSEDLEPTLTPALEKFDIDKTSEN